MSEPELMARRPLDEQSDGPAHRWFNQPASGRWYQPVLSEWELRAAHWTDHHQHDELNYVLEGELHVECGGVTVTGRAGDVIRVPSGSTGHYWAPSYARMLAVYGPNPDGTPATERSYRSELP
jgi:mannose-6-phosphate isomerase-like protein (cupin superfamily)